MAKALVDHIAGLLEQAKASLTILADSVPDDPEPAPIETTPVQTIPPVEPVEPIPGRWIVRTPTEAALADSINLDDEKLEAADEAAESAVTTLPS